jgi:hypothetical protein
LTTGTTELDATTAFTMASGCADTRGAVEATSGAAEGATGAGAAAGTKLEELVLWEFKEFIAFFSSLWNTLFIRSVAYRNNQADMVTYKYVNPKKK